MSKLCENCRTITTCLEMGCGQGTYSDNKPIKQTITPESIKQAIDIEALQRQFENEKIERQTFQHGYRLASDNCARLEAENAALRKELEEARKDGERFVWWFDDTNKGNFLTRYMQGMQEHWSVDRWRTEIDAARKQTS